MKREFIIVKENIQNIINTYESVSICESITINPKTIELEGHFNTRVIYINLKHKHSKVSLKSPQLYLSNRLSLE